MFELPTNIDDLKTIVSQATNEEHELLNGVVLNPLIEKISGLFQGLDDNEIVLSQAESLKILQLFNSSVGSLKSIDSGEIDEIRNTYEEIRSKLNQIINMLSEKVRSRE